MNKLYTAKPIDIPSTVKGTWSTMNVEVLEGDNKIGSYTRNYSSFFKTFYPFYLNNQWYALRSSHYTSSEVMSLPNCEVVAAEIASAGGFCPTEFYVPKYKATKLRSRATGAVHYSFVWDNEDDYETRYSNMKDYEVIEFTETYIPYGFVSGCVWGDDSSWKIQMFDLRFLTEGKLNRVSPGYMEMADDHSLKESIEFIDFFDYKTGECESGYRIQFVVKSSEWVDLPIDISKSIKVNKD